MANIKFLIFDPTYPVHVRPASKLRDLPNNAQRCLPLSIAAQYGYEILVNHSFTIEWTGVEFDIGTTITWDDPKAKEQECAWVNGGHGFFSFNTNLILRTPPGINTYIGGPPNLIKRGVQPMTAIIETDWNITHLSMNYKITEPNYKIRFEKGDPFCTLFFLPRKMEERFYISMELLADHPQEYETFMKFRDKLNENNHDRKGHYRRGEYLAGGECPVDHQKRLNISPIEQKS